MAIPLEIQLLIAMAKQQMPELAHLPDEVVAEIITQALQEEQIASSARDQNLENMSAGGLNLIAEELIKRGQWDAAEERLLLALEKSEKEKDYVHMFWALKNLGYICRERGNHSQAITILRQALALAEGLNDRLLQGTVYNEMGNVYNGQGNYPKSIEYYKRSLQDGYYEDDQDLALGYGNLGVVYFLQGDFANAKTHFERAINLCHKLGDSYQLAMWSNHLGNVLLEQADYEMAIEMYMKALQINKRIGNLQEQAFNYSNLGAVHKGLGKHEQAIQMYQKSLEIFERIGDEPNVARCYGNLAAVYQLMGDIGQALAYHHKSLKTRERIGDRHGAAITYFNLGLLYRDLGEVEQARIHYEKAKALFEIVGDAQHAQWAARELREL